MFSRFRFNQFKKSPTIVRVLIAQQFLEGFVPIMALYAIMFERVGGLSFQQISLLFAAWSAAYVVAELPSGVLADYWSRKKVIALGGMVRCVGFLLWLLWPSFGGYLIGFALWGVAIACTSGAVAAYLHNELEADHKSSQFAKFYGWVMAALYAGMLTGYGVAALLTLRRSGWLIGLSALSSFLFAAILWRVRERPYRKQDTYLKTLRAGLRAVTQSRKLMHVCFVLFSTFMIIGVLEELLPRVYAGFGATDTAISLLLALSLLFTTLLLTRLETFVRFSLSKQVLVMAGGLVVLLAGLQVGGISGIGLVLLFDLVFQLFRPVFMHHVQDAADTDERATIGSIPGLAAGVLGAGAYLWMGKVAAGSSERFSIGVYGAIWLAILIITAFLVRSSARPSGESGSPAENLGKFTQ